MTCVGSQAGLQRSEDHRCQKCRSRDWHKCHRLSAVMSRSSMSEFGIASRGLPMRKCPGVKASMPSSSSGRVTSGLLLRQASIWHKTFESSSKLSFTLPTIRARCFLQAFDGRLPQSTKVGGPLWDKIPCNALECAEIGDSFLSSRLTKESIEISENT